MQVPYNKIHIPEEALNNIKESINKKSAFEGGGVKSSSDKYTKLCEKWFRNKMKAKAILTFSCTASLEMAALLTSIHPEDEIIMPSYTYVSTANAFVLRGAIPVFVDININTMNIDENLIEKAVTKKTKAIVVVHYAGIACNMDKILEIAGKYNLIVIEDAAHAIGSKYNGKYLGTIGDIGCLSFHTTKNITCGEGGAILINKEKYNNSADIISEKGTNRSSCISGKTNKYTWCDIGSSFKMADINAAILYTQLQKLKKITEKRIKIWNIYKNFFMDYEDRGDLKCPFVPEKCEHNAHIFYLLFNDNALRNQFIRHMKKYNIATVSHYVPLHSSPAGKRFGRVASSMKNTDKAANCIVRLPLFFDLEDKQTDYILFAAKKGLAEIYKKETLNKK
ncbi:MAG: dTDP-4-amino-4,6-dideoxygalactose transaminase [Candidatus Avigastranaerophilus sp.]